jgi:hypothetical protein
MTTTVRSHIVLILEVHHDERIPVEELSEIYGTWVEHIPAQYRTINTETREGEKVATAVVRAVSSSALLGHTIQLN